MESDDKVLNLKMIQEKQNHEIIIEWNQRNEKKS